MKRIPFISLEKLHEPMHDDLMKAFNRVIDSGYFINGKEVEAFSAELADLLGLDHVVPASNGLDSLRLILRAYIETGRLKPGDEVIVPSNSFIATFLPLTEFNLTPVFVKSDLTTYGLDWNEALESVTEKTRAMITVHLYGTPSWDFTVAEKLREKGIILIEDNAQAIGARIMDPRTGNFHFTGSLGDAAAFSFYPTKNVGAFGDAGAVATHSQEIAETVKSLANYGTSKRYYNDYFGYNCRMDEMHAALLRVKLKHLHLINERRRNNVALYDRLLRNDTVLKPELLSGMEQVWHQYVIRTPKREALRALLDSNGVTTEIHYPVSVFDQKCYADINLKVSEDCKTQARMLSDEVLSLPIGTATEQEINYITDIINRFD